MRIPFLTLAFQAIYLDADNALARVTSLAISSLTGASCAQGLAHIRRLQRGWHLNRWRSSATKLHGSYPKSEPDDRVGDRIPDFHGLHGDTVDARRHERLVGRGISWHGCSVPVLGSAQRFCVLGHGHWMGRERGGLQPAGLCRLQRVHRPEEPAVAVTAIGKSEVRSGHDGSGMTRWLQRLGKIARVAALCGTVAWLVLVTISPQEPDAAHPSVTPTDTTSGM